MHAFTRDDFSDLAGWGYIDIPSICVVMRDHYLGAFLGTNFFHCNNLSKYWAWSSILQLLVQMPTLHFILTDKYRRVAPCFIWEIYFLRECGGKLVKLKLQNCYLGFPWEIQEMQSWVGDNYSCLSHEASFKCRFHGRYRGSNCWNYCMGVRSSPAVSNTVSQLLT